MKQVILLATLGVLLPACDGVVVVDEPHAAYVYDSSPWYYDPWPAWGVGSVWYGGGGYYGGHRHHHHHHGGHHGRHHGGGGRHHR